MDISLWISKTIRYSVKPRDQRYGQCYGFLSLTQNIGKNLNIKYAPKIVDSTKKFAADAFKTVWKREIKKNKQNQNKKQATGDLINNKIAKLQVLHQLNQNC